MQLGFSGGNNWCNPIQQSLGGNVAFECVGKFGWWANRFGMFSEVGMGHLGILRGFLLQ